MTPDEAKRKLAEMLASRDEEEKRTKIKQRAININLNSDKFRVAQAKQRIIFE